MLSPIFSYLNDVFFFYDSFVYYVTFVNYRSVSIASFILIRLHTNRLKSA